MSKKKKLEDLQERIWALEQQVGLPYSSSFWIANMDTNKDITNWLWMRDSYRYSWQCI